MKTPKRKKKSIWTQDFFPATIVWIISLPAMYVMSTPPGYYPSSRDSLRYTELGCFYGNTVFCYTGNRNGNGLWGIRGVLDGFPTHTEGWVCWRTWALLELYNTVGSLLLVPLDIGLPWLLISTPATASETLCTLETVYDYASMSNSKGKPPWQPYWPAISFC